MSNVLIRTADMVGDPAQTRGGPSTIGELNRVPLVAALQTLAVTAVGAQGEPQGVVDSARTNVGLNLGTAGLPVGMNAVKAVGEQITPFGAKHDDRGKMGTLLEVSDVIVDHREVDSGPHLRARVEHDAVERQRLANGNAGRQLGRKARRVGTLVG